MSEESTKPAGVPDEPTAKELADLDQPPPAPVEDDEPERDAVWWGERLRLGFGCLLAVAAVGLLGAVLVGAWVWMRDWKAMLLATHGAHDRDVMLGLLVAKACITIAIVGGVLGLVRAAERLLVPFAYADEAPKLTGRLRTASTLDVLYLALVNRLQGKQE